MSVKVTVGELVAEANKHVTALSVTDAAALMIEFWVDSTSPYFKQEFDQGKTCVFFCQSGWRSALATKSVQDMGMKDVIHIDGGFRAWCKADKPIQTYADNRVARKALREALAE